MSEHLHQAVSHRAIRRTTIVLVLVMIGVVVLIGIRLYQRMQPLPAQTAPLLAIETITLEHSVFLRSIQASGTVEAEKRVVLSAQLSASVSEIPFREGARIKQGDILVRLDKSEPQQNVARLKATTDRLEAELLFWRDQLKADRRLLESKTISSRDFKETQRQVTTRTAALREAEEDLQSARIRLDYTTIQAPFDGYIQRVHVLPGEFVQTGSRLLEILAVEPLKVVVPIAERDLSRLQEDQAASIHIPAVGGTWNGVINRLYPGLERDTRSATVEIFLPRELQSVRPGMAAEVDIILLRDANALAIPRQAVLERAGTHGVFLLIDGRAHWRPIRVGAAQNERIQILDGLRVGDEVIITPHPRLVDGRAVIARNDWRRTAP